MPELPEVETIRRDLEGRIIGRRITGVVLAPETGKAVPVLKGIDETSFRENIVGARIESVERRGKYLALRLDSTLLLIVHLRMTGRLLLRKTDDEPDRFLRITLKLDDGSELRFADMRKFGGFWLAEDYADAMATALGPEPMGELFTVDSMTAALKNRKTPVKAILLDQRYIAGIGNIYADEACYLAGIDPRRFGAEVTADEATRLHEAVRSVIGRGIESRGASFSDYADVNGDKGGMQMLVQVFRRTGKPCYVCGSTIERVKVGGRSTHFCPTCQR